MFDREQAKGVFTRYAEQYDTSNILIFHKIEYTLRVAELAGRYAAAQGMNALDTNFAWFLGLLHDIGRFEQIRRSPKQLKAFGAWHITGELRQHSTHKP